jgi:hypothetical protein
MSYKNFLEIDKEKEPEKFNIFNGLVTHGKYIINNVDEKPWWETVGKQIGKASVSLTDGNKSRLLIPPTKTTHNNPERIVVITPNINVFVKEEKITDLRSKFIFIRKL